MGGRYLLLRPANTLGVPKKMKKHDIKGPGKWPGTWGTWRFKSPED